MKARHGITPIPLPAIQTSPTGIGRLSRETRKALAAVRDRKIIVSGASGRGGSIKLPLDVYGLTKDESTFTVFVRPGYVIERTVINDTGTDCLTYHEPTGILDMSDDPVPHTVANNQSVFVKVTVQDDGTISAAEIEVAASDTESTHYAPPVGDETAGDIGEYYYKLAEFTTDGDTLAVKKFHAGANIDHFQELPRFVKAGGTADVFKTFDQEAGQYKTRGITAGAGITVTQNTDDIEVALEGGGDNFDISLVDVEISIDGSGNEVTISPSSGTYNWYVRNGLLTRTAPDDAGLVDRFDLIYRVRGTSTSSGAGFYPET